MVYLEKYNKNKTYMAPSGAIFTPEVVKQKYPAVEVFTFVIWTDEAGEIFGGLDSLNNLRSRYDIDKGLGEDEAIEEIQRILNLPQPEPEPSAEERIAAALEYQNLINS